MKTPYMNVPGIGFIKITKTYLASYVPSLKKKQVQSLWNKRRLKRKMKTKKGQATLPSSGS